MTISTVSGAVVVAVADAIKAARNGVAVDHVLRYHRLLPEDCPTENGTLSVSVLYPTNPTKSAYPVAELDLRYFQCWPRPARVEGKTVLDIDGWDVRSAALQEVADAGVRCLRGLERNCVALLGEHGCGGFRFIDCRPTGPRGDAAGWVWRATAAVRSGATLAPPGGP
jgi:hypothetical protein